MKKVIIQGLVTVSIFLGGWWALTQINWMGIFEVKRITNDTEKKLGDLFWEYFSKEGSENKNSGIDSTTRNIITKICKANNIDTTKIKPHILNSDEVNAFALPDGHLVIYTGLIKDADNPEELAGVIAHEIAHIQLNHVMKKLVKEVGLSTLFAIASGGGGATKEMAKILSSTAFDRELEKSADLKAVDYLIRANINPKPFADFLYKISVKENNSTKYFTWISTHPNSEERAKYIIDYAEKQQNHK